MTIPLKLNQLSKRQKITIVGIVLAFLSLGACWNFLVAKALNSAEARVLSKVNENINGTIQVGAIDFSFFGTLNAHQVTINDSQNVLIGKIDNISVRFNLRDLLFGNPDLHSLTSVVLENPVILLENKNGRWNWENLLKTPTEQPLTFRGSIEVKQATIANNTMDNRIFEAVNGKIDFSGYPSISLDLSGKTRSTNLTAKGNWAFDGSGSLKITSDQIALSDLPLALILPAGIQFSGGEIKKAVFDITRQSGNLAFTGEASMKNAAANISGYSLTQGNGTLRMTQDKLDLQDFDALIDGQKVLINGTISYSGAQVNLNLSASSDRYDAAVLTGNSFSGPIAFQANIAGSPSNLVAKGQFSIPQGAFGAFSFTNCNGAFSYSEGILTLVNTRASAWDGTLVINGNVIPSTKKYRMTASSSGVDSALLTEKDIQGRVAFDAVLNGQGTNEGQAEGSFRMGEGSFSGIPFLGMTGDFSKQGAQVNFYNIVVRTIAGTFKAEGLSTGSVVKLKKIEPSSIISRETINKDSVKKTITDKLKSYLPH